MNVQPVSQKKEETLWTLTLDFTHHALFSLAWVKASSDLFRVCGYYTSKLGPEPVSMYNGKIKAATSNSSQPSQKNPLPMSQWSLKCQYYEG